MERKTKNPTAVPSLKDKTKENNQTQNYDILNPNVFQNISKCFPKLLAEAFTARLQHHQSLRHWVAASQSIALCTEEIAGDYFCNTHQNIQDPCAENSISKQKKCLCFLSEASLNVMELNCYMGFQEESQWMHMARCPHLHGRLLRFLRFFWVFEEWLWNHYSASNLWNYGK